MKLKKIVFFLVIVLVLGSSVVLFILVKRDSPLFIVYGDPTLSTGNFLYRNEIRCSVLDQEDNLGTWLPSSLEFKLQKLNEENVIMVFSEFEGMDISMRKIYESSRKVVIEYSQNGNTQVVSLDKNTGVFVRTITGHISGPQNYDSEYAIAQKGRCG